MGVRVGSVDKIEPAGDKMKVTFHYPNKYKVPANASAVILNPTLVASRNIQLEPPYNGGPVLADNTVIPIERTQVPVEWDQLRNSITKIISKLGPTPEQPKGPFGEVIESFADGLAGKGKQINTTLNSLSTALTALNEGRGEIFAVVRSLALFVNALHQNDQQLVALNQNLAQLHQHGSHSDHDVADAVEQFDGLLATFAQVPRPEPPGADPRRQQPRRRDDHAGATRTAERLGDLPARRFRRAAANSNQIYHPAHGALSPFPRSPTSRTRWSSSAARSRPAAGSGIRIPPNCVRNTWRRSSTRSSSTTCRSA